MMGQCVLCTKIYGAVVTHPKSIGAQLQRSEIGQLAQPLDLANLQTTV